MLQEALPAGQVTVFMSCVKHCCDSSLLFRRSGVGHPAFAVRDRFFARRETEPDDAWSSQEIAHAILILIGNNQSFRPVLVGGCLYDRVAHTRAMNVDSHDITIDFGFNKPWHLAEASRIPNVC